MQLKAVNCTVCSVKSPGHRVHLMTCLDCSEICYALPEIDSVIYAVCFVDKHSRIIIVVIQVRAHNNYKYISN